MQASTSAFSAVRKSRQGLSLHTLGSLAGLHSKILVVGAGSGGLAVASQLQNAFKAEKRPLKKEDLAIIDPSEEHNYQPGWTLVGTGLASLDSCKKPMSEVIPNTMTHHKQAVSSFQPERNQITLDDNQTLTYDYLVVAPGLKTNFAGIKGLEKALADPKSGVSSIYGKGSAVKTWESIKNLKQGTAIFTQPAGPIKCAGAPQKVLWMADSQWRREGLRNGIEPIFASGMPSMFAVPKYAAALEQLRKDRNVDGLFTHNLTSVDGDKKVATFTKPDGSAVDRSFDMLHAVPPQGPLDFIKNSPIADSAGWVNVNKDTAQHNQFANIFSLGDASSLPNSKTMAAAGAQAPVVVDNLRAFMDGKPLPGTYDGYASCPLLTGHNELMLAEFKYGGIPKETFSWLPFIKSQDIPRTWFYYLKKDFFPWVYWKYHLAGKWFGSRGWLRPIYYHKLD